jgi:hypothetical protein
MAYVFDDFFVCYKLFARIFFKRKSKKRRSLVTQVYATERLIVSALLAPYPAGSGCPAHTGAA